MDGNNYDDDGLNSDIPLEEDEDFKALQLKYQDNVLK